MRMRALARGLLATAATAINSWPPLTRSSRFEDGRFAEMNEQIQAIVTVLSRKSRLVKRKSELAAA